jgi:hypothetical protein
MSHKHSQLKSAPVLKHTTHLSISCRITAPSIVATSTISNSAMLSIKLTIIPNRI